MKACILNSTADLDNSFLNSEKEYELNIRGYVNIVLDIEVQWESYNDVRNIGDSQKYKEFIEPLQQNNSASGGWYYYFNWLMKDINLPSTEL